MLLASNALFLEYEDVLLRAELLLDLGLDREAALRLVARLAALCVPVETHFKTRPLLPDPDDEIVLEVAINGRADAIVTYNLKDFASARRVYALPILLPAAMLERLRS